jgi:hypothetical protein
MSTQKTLGWIVAAAGALALLLGLTLGSLAVALQLADPQGPTTNLQGFLVVCGVCPLPLTVLGAAVMAMGLGVVYAAHRAEKNTSGR